MQKKENITGIILAGGKSSRMGSDKSLLTYNKVSFIQHVLNAMKPLVEDIIIVSNSNTHDKFGYKRVEDIIKDSGPLAGIHSGLSQSPTDYNLVLSCDIPLIKTEILEVLVHSDYTNYDVVQIQSGEKTMPLIALYHKRCSVKCKALLDEGERRLRVAVKQLNTKSIIINSQWEDFVKNINTIDDLKEIEYAVKH
ncbi:molybdenum cofactor guanylyltransferase [Hanstruepera flava]|uniref:molybdenum cofactor guanylyltransferase n=1 Tax=Hanstruepera flava TaxID=2930218 RepID=UPI0020281AF6|nr:molybdenum cofactor guanylyltransferase [Hanstruepera flava]